MRGYPDYSTAKSTGTRQELRRVINCSLCGSSFNPSRNVPVHVWPYIQSRNSSLHVCPSCDALAFPEKP